MTPPATPADLPSTLHGHVLPPMRVRPLRPGDGPALERLARACDPEDLRLRFFQAIGEGHRSLLDKLTRLDPARDAAFIAFEPRSRTPLGVVRLHGDPGGREAEFAILVRSDAHNHGIGHALMSLIIEDGAQARLVSDPWRDPARERSDALICSRSRLSAGFDAGGRGRGATQP